MGSCQNMAQKTASLEVPPRNTLPEYISPSRHVLVELH